jgi:hypothetical protein
MGILVSFELSLDKVSIKFDYTYLKNKSFILVL